MGETPTRLTRLLAPMLDADGPDPEAAVDSLLAAGTLNRCRHFE